MLTLYYAPGTISMAVHIVLEEIGCDYDTVRLDFYAGEQRGAAYLALNPKGRVPLLRTDEGDLTETAAVLSYLADRYPEGGLLPEGRFARAQAMSFMVYLASTVHVNHAHKGRGARWVDDPAAEEAMRAKVPANMAECMGLIERTYLAGPWVMGERYTVCDPYLHVICRWLAGDGVDIAAFPALAAHAAAMEKRPAVRALLPLHVR